MGTLAALLIATPIFGFQLSLDPGYMPQTPMSHGAAVQLAMQLPADDSVEDDGEGSESSPSATGGSVAERMQTRARLTPLHKWMGIATWASMTVTVALGWLQYNNLYGFFSSAADTPCVSGSPAFGQAACVDTPWPHLATSILTAALYTSTFTLSLRMPDPIGLDNGDGEYARNLRRHKRLRWVHFAGMVLQMGLGIVIANAESFGMDRANNYGALQALSTVHLGIGLMTYATMTWAGLIFLLN
ncbi:MAG: hypothetical protein ACI9KE_003316 [Polyangiales bacterium]|jgi:hypothetical protein